VGAEFQKLKARGLDPELGAVGMVDFARVAEAFGLAGHTVRERADANRAVDRFLVEGNTHIVDVKVPTIAVSRYYRQRFFGAAV